MRATAASSSDHGLMPDDNRIGAPVATMASSSSTLPTSPEATFHTGMPTRSSSSTASTEKAELRNNRPASAAWAARPCHWASVNSIRFQ